MRYYITSFALSAKLEAFSPAKRESPLKREDAVSKTIRIRVHLMVGLTMIHTVSKFILVRRKKGGCLRIEALRLLNAPKDVIDLIPG